MLSAITAKLPTRSARLGVLLLLPALTTAYLVAQTQGNHETAQDLAEQLQLVKVRTAAVLERTEHQRLAPNAPQTFRAEFPKYELRHERVAHFMNRLALLGPVTPSTSFNQAALGDTGLVAYTVNLNTTAPYSAWRDFMDDALHDDGALALSSLRLSRADASVSQLRVQAVFTFYMQSAQDNVP